MPWFAAAELATVALARWAGVLLPVLLRRADHSSLPPVSWRPPVASGG